MSASGSHLSWFRLIQVLFPPDCIALSCKLKRVFVEFLHRLEKSGCDPRQFQIGFGAGLEIPTEKVVY
jgi:hypothetical protein